MISDKLVRYCDLLYETNRRVRLTGYREKELIYKLIEDSILPFKFLNLQEKREFLDVGTGGGIPGIPLAIIFPNVHFYLLDSIIKKTEAVAYFINSLNLPNVEVITKRVEDYGKNNFDYVGSKAVAKLSVLIELTASKVKIGGKLFFYKGKTYLNEINDSKAIQKIMGIELSDVINYSDNRYMIVFQKAYAHNENFPRPYKKIMKKPVV